MATIPLSGKKESGFGILSGFRAQNVISSRYSFGLFAKI